MIALRAVFFHLELNTVLHVDSLTPSQMTTEVIPPITLLDRVQTHYFPTSINKLIIKAASFIKLYGVSKKLLFKKSLLTFILYS